MFNEATFREILVHDVINSNVNQYKVDRSNVEISAFSSGDLNKYEFLKRIDLNYKPNELDKARFEFSPLGKAFNEGLDKTIPNYQKEGVIKLLKEIRDNLAGLAIPPGPPSSPGSPSSPSSSSLPPSSPGSSSSSSLTNVTLLLPSGSPRKTRTVRPRPTMSKIAISKRYQSSDVDDALKELDEKYKKYNLDNASKEINERIKLLKEEEKQRHERIKLLKEQEKQRHELNKLLKEQKQEEDIDWDQINELSRKANELTENINSRSPTNLRKFAPRRDPFDDKNKNKKKLTPSPSKIHAPIPKSLEPQGVAVREQAGIDIMKNGLKTSKNHIEYLKKELNNTDLLSKKTLKTNNKIIQEEDKVRKLDKEIREREEDIERRFRKYYPDKYYL